MKILDNINRDVEHKVTLISAYNKLLKHALQLGFCYNDDIVVGLHNKIAEQIQTIKKDSNNELICKIWKNGKVVVCNRKEYIAYQERKNLILKNRKDKAAAK